MHTVTVALGRPIQLFFTGGQTSDFIGARGLAGELPAAQVLLADRGYDADRFRKPLKNRVITQCIPPRKMRKFPIPHDADHYKRRHKIENSFARLKDWRRVATHYFRCTKVFLSAIVLLWLGVLGPAFKGRISAGMTSNSCAAKLYNERAQATFRS